MKQSKVLMATGGTGGHVFPAIATAYELAEMGCQVAFATDVRGEKYLEDKSFPYKIINSASPSGNAWQKIKFAFKTGIGILQAISIIKKEDVDIVVGFGGYPSFPAIFAAKLLKKKIVLHEQNSVLGKVNAFSLKYANAVATSFEKTRYAEGNDYVGNPVRAEITPQEYPANNGKLNIFITGGSQGAKSFSDLFPDVFEGIDNIFITQQVLAEDIEAVKLKYQLLGIDHELQPFFHDINKKITEANLIICRSGSSTIAEISMIGRPAIFIPLPTSADNHQFYNAKALEETKGAWLLEEKDLDKKLFGEKLKTLLGNYDALKQASSNIRKFAKPDAAKDLAKIIMSHV